MELKLKKLIKVHDKIHVLIVPLWNWNRDIPDKNDAHRGKVLIVPLWNWNRGNNSSRKPRKGVLTVPLWNWNTVGQNVHPLGWCFNRTFMELKCNNRFRCSNETDVLIVPLWNWNYERAFSILLEAQVLIVPLWNWNFATMMVRMVSKSFNRTFMELKLRREKTTKQRTTSFNRTFMELK